MKKIKLLLLVIVLLFTFSCQEEELVDTQEDVVSEVSEGLVALTEDLIIHAAIQDVGKTFSSVILNNSDMIELIRKKALEEFDGDYDVLYDDIKDLKFKDPNSKSGEFNSFANMLSSAYGASDSKSINVSAKSFEEKISDIPDLNFYFHKPDLKDSENMLFVAMRYDVNDMDIEEIIAYDKYGNEHTLSAEGDGPDVPVICLTVNERLQFVDKPDEKVEKGGAYVPTYKGPPFELLPPDVNFPGNHIHVIEKLKLNIRLDPWFTGRYDEPYALYALGNSTFYSCKTPYGNLKVGQEYTISNNFMSFPAVIAHSWIAIEFWEKDGNQNLEYNISGKCDLEGNDWVEVDAKFFIDNKGVISDDEYGSRTLYAEHPARGWQSIGGVNAIFSWHGDLIDFGYVDAYIDWVESGSPVIVPVDVLDPTPPSNLRVENITTTSAFVVWNPSNDNVAVYGYDIYLNDVFLGATSSLNFALTGLTIGTYYTVTVKAIDSVGNESRDSFMSFSTLTGPPPPPPPGG